MCDVTYIVINMCIICLNKLTTDSVLIWSLSNFDKTIFEFVARLDGVTCPHEMGQGQPSIQSPS